MKTISKKEAEKLLKDGKAKLYWSTIYATYTLVINGDYIEKQMSGLQSSYRVQYKTGVSLDRVYKSISK